MKYISTRNSKIKYSIDQAINLGLAPDGGLFVPVKIPKVNIQNYHSLTFPDLASKLLSNYFDKNLKLVCKKAFNFKVPLIKLNENTSVLELFHGPTCAFKDFAARFMAEYLNQFQSSSKLKTVLVATSGDTGGAVASAFLNKKNYRVVILYPKDKVSKRQEKQLTSFGNNVHAIAVNGTFDDCQKIVKQSFLDKRFKKFNLMSANSVNLARILPQVVYYAFISLKKPKASWIIPTGNLGNATACLIAKKMGFPIGKVIFACNSNDTLYKYYSTGKYNPQKSKHTLANAMDVGAPSNFERVQHFYPNYSQFKKNISVVSISDVEIRKFIKKTYKEHHYIICPHTATAFAAIEKLNIKGSAIIASTAHPAKFDSMVELCVNTKIKTPKMLADLLKRSSSYFNMKPRKKYLYSYLKNLK